MYYDLSPEAASMARNVLHKLRPYCLEGQNKIRVGRMFDGGYVMLDRFEGIEAAYSLGINDDVSWDLDMARRGIPVFQYDHTIEQLPADHPLFYWEKTRISGPSEVGDGVDTLANLMDKNGHATSRDLILKCDIEGSEWLLLRETPNNYLKAFRQIVLEMHSFSFLGMHEHADNVRSTIENLTASHTVVHVHGNNFASWAVVGGIPVPEVLELTLVRNDEGEFSMSDEVFPTPLDMPCHSKSADLYLGRFEFAGAGPTPLTPPRPRSPPGAAGGRGWRSGRPSVRALLRGRG